MVTHGLDFLEGSRRCSNDWPLIGLLGDEDQVMARAATFRKHFREEHLDRLLAVVPHRCHARHGASNRDVLKLPAAILPTEKVGAVCIVSDNRDNVKGLRW